MLMPSPSESPASTTRWNSRVSVPVPEAYVAPAKLFDPMFIHTVGVPVTSTEPL